MSAPERVQLLPKLSDTLEVATGLEQGIDAENPAEVVPGNETMNGISLQWERLSSEVEQYQIFRRADNPDGNFQQVGSVFPDRTEADTTFLDRDSLDVDRSYYYSVRALNSEGLAGELAEPDYYMLMPKPALRYPVVEAQQYNDTFQWELDGFVETYFIFRLEKLGVRKYVPLIAFMRDITGNIQSEQQWTLQQLAQDSLYDLSAGSYRWRIDVRRLNDIQRGAESNWGYFKVIP